MFGGKTPAVVAASPPNLNRASAGLVRTQAAVLALEARIGQVISIEAAMRAGLDQGAAGKRGGVVAALAPVIRAFTRHFANLLGHRRLLELGDPTPAAPGPSA